DLEEQQAEGMEGTEGSLFEDRELADIINSFLADLKPGTRRVFMLRYWYFLSVKEIMSECGMSKSKVESILFRTRGKLKVHLERVWKVK
ncbi:MAG: sigma-70 family RNA polymerase sigma factor, partial [Lachnospiraceae bacterium]|nr:sigma-70 family RNA polymerase sigma factor [Lachnospiraceae bacterium]